ncbi:MAG TPA: hypothetical protein VMH05_03430 [Bryobacteraceae bacterium]|nr:hypothetical protein [Bryobacteraceae bacterium]
MYDVTDRNLVLFPLGPGSEKRVLLPRALGVYQLSPNGKTLYSTAGEIHDLTELTKVTPGFFRIELGSKRISDVSGSGDFTFLSSIAISPRQVDAVIAGKYWNNGRVVCGVFSLNLLDGKARQILDGEGCDDALTRTDISLSPDSKYAVAIHRRSLELIDIASGGVQKLGDGFMKVAWSPDGKWIAAAKYSVLQANIVLFDGKTFAARKTLASSIVLRVLWSPDSRFLLARRSVAGCGPDAFTYETFEVQSGKGSLVQSSRCKVWNANDVGWVDQAIATNR